MKCSFVSSSGWVTVTDRIKRVRRNLSLTQEEFAAAIGVTARAVQRWEAGHAPGPKQLRRIAELAEKPVAWFYEDEEAAVA